MASKACIDAQNVDFRSKRLSLTSPGEPKRAFQPLLPPGRHFMTMAALEELTVKRFPESSARPAIFAEFQRLVNELVAIGLVGEIWADGSFLTEKANPEVDDMDLSIRVTVEHFETHPMPIQQALLHALGGGKRYSAVLDTYISVIFPKGDPRIHGGTDDYWAEKWLLGWDDKLKGFAVILLGETDLGFRLHAR